MFHKRKSRGFIALDWRRCSQAQFFLVHQLHDIVEVIRGQYALETMNTLEPHRLAPGHIAQRSEKCSANFIRAEKLGWVVNVVQPQTTDRRVGSTVNARSNMDVILLLLPSLFSDLIATSHTSDDF